MVVLIVVPDSKIRVARIANVMMLCMKTAGELYIGYRALGPIKRLNNRERSPYDDVLASCQQERFLVRRWCKGVHIGT